MVTRLSTERPERVARGAFSAIAACAPVREGVSCPFASFAFEAVPEAPALGAGVDDVRFVRDPVNDGLREPGVGEHFGPFNCSWHTFGVVGYR